MSHFQLIVNKSVVFSALGLLALAALIVAFRLHTFDEPLERDITAHAIIGHQLLAGKSLYVDIWDHKPPAIYWTNALSESIFGYGQNNIFALNVITSIITLIAIYFAGKRYAGGSFTGLIAGAFWVLLSQSLRLEANQPNCEAFINCCLSIIFAILTTSKNLGNKSIFFVGIITTWACLYKPIALPPVFCLLAARIIFCDPLKRKQYFKQALGVVEVTFVSLLCVAIYFFQQNSLPDFCDAVFAYNYADIQESESSLGRYLEFLSYGLNLDLYVSTLLATSSVVAIVRIIFREQHPRLWILWLAYLVGTIAAILIPKHYFPHYFQLILPIAAIGCAWALNSLQNTFVNIVKRLSPSSTRSTIAIISAVFYMILILAIAGPLYFDRMNTLRFSANKWSVEKYGTLFVDQRMFGEKLKSLLLPNETIFVWGHGTGIYFYSQRNPATCLVFSDPLTSNVLNGKISQRVIGQLSANRPPLIVFCCDVDKDKANKISQDECRIAAMQEFPVSAWIAHNYSFYKMIELDNRYFALFLLPKNSINTRLSKFDFGSK